jgi:transcriptional regulator with XRE-family HTH domain
VSATDLTQDELRERLRLAPLELIAQRVRRARRTCGLSHDAIGERMGGTFRQTLIKWEKAKYRPTLESLTKYAEATGRHVEWFLDPDLDPSPFQEEAA